VSYINTYADIKALSDACCTSSNAANVIQAMNAPRVIFLPDAFLAANTAKELGKKIAYAKKGPRRRSFSPMQTIGQSWAGKEAARSTIASNPRM